MTFLRFLPAILWMVLIFWLSASPDLRGASGFIDLRPPFDKVVHAASFGLLALFFYFATGRAFLSVLLASLYGVSDEIHQSFVPGRDADLFDWVADTLGATLAVSLALFSLRLRSRQVKKLQ